MLSISNIFFSGYSAFQDAESCDVSLYTLAFHHHIVLTWRNGKFFSAYVDVDGECWDYRFNEADKFESDYPSIFNMAQQYAALCSA